MKDKERPQIYREQSRTIARIKQKSIIISGLLFALKLTESNSKSVQIRVPSAALPDASRDLTDGNLWLNNLSWD